MYGADAAIAAKRRQKQREKEEEQMTKYSTEDLEGWEFKIVRSTMGAFKDLEKVQALCTEEAKSGWEMIEKFDNGRIRFKRKVQMRSQDSLSVIDPYRTSFGLGEGQLASIVIGVVLLLVGLVFIFSKL